MKCIYCNKDVPDNSTTCPWCGCVLPTKGNNLPLIIIGIIIFIVIAGSFGIIYYKSNSVNTYKEPIEKVEDEDEIIRGPGSEDENSNSNNNYDDENTIRRNEIKVYEFYGSTCSYCMSLNNWFTSIEDEYGKYFELVKFEVWSSQENQELMYDVADYLNITVSGVPFVVIGDKYTLGFSETTTPNIIINYIMEEYNKSDSERIDIIEKVKDK